MALALSVWATVVAWALIGLVHLLIGFTGHGWAFHDEYLIVWGALVVLALLSGLHDRE